MFAIFAASPASIKDSTTVGRRPKAAGPPLWRRPKAASIMVDGEPANIAKTYGNRYQILADLYILPISPYSPVVAPGAIQLAKSEGALANFAWILGGSGFRV